jgi:tetratricopeptide (TPR) repeat protein
LNRFSKALLLLMGAFVILYLVRELMPSAPTERAAKPTSHLGLVRPGADHPEPSASKNESGLVESLKSPSGSVRDQATSSLWKLWQSAAGPDAERRLQAGMDMLASGHPLAAVDQFSKLVADYPEFAEAYNKRAIAYFSMADYERSIQDCLKTTELNKSHFGAWSGLGRCYVAIRRFDLALHAFERALELQPFSEEHKRAIEFCKEKKKNMLPQDLNSSA